MSGFQSQQTSLFARKSFQPLLFLLPHLLSSCQHSQYRPNCSWRWPKWTFCLVAANSAQCKFSILQQKIHLLRLEDDHSLCWLLHGLVAECKIFGPFVWQILSKFYKTFPSSSYGSCSNWSSLVRPSQKVSSWAWSQSCFPIKQTSTHCLINREKMTF